MSHYGEADEAQRRHYNDGYTPYPNDSDRLQYPPRPHPPYPPYLPYPPQIPYGCPPPSPPPTIIRPASTTFALPPPPLPRPSSSFAASSVYSGPSTTPATMYDHEEHDDTGESPLLRRHPSDMHIPLTFEEGENAPPVVDDARSYINVGFLRGFRVHTRPSRESSTSLFSFLLLQLIFLKQTLAGSSVATLFSKMPSPKSS
jgi:hypothetical protein